MIIRASQMSPDAKNDWLSLWPSDDLENSYRAAITAMGHSRSRLDSLSLAEAAKETLLVGQSVIRAINFDPQLPEEFASTELFDTMLAQMVDYNKVGLERWQAY